MGKINEQHLLDEIRFDIKQKDIIKASLVLAELDNVGLDTQKKALFEISRADDDFSIPLLAGFVITMLPALSTFDFRFCFFAKSKTYFLIFSSCFEQ